MLNTRMQGEAKLLSIILKTIRWSSKKEKLLPSGPDLECPKILYPGEGKDNYLGIKCMPKKYVRIKLKYVEIGLRRSNYQIISLFLGHIDNLKRKTRNFVRVFSVQFSESLCYLTALSTVKFCFLPVHVDHRILILSIAAAISRNGLASKAA